MFGPERKLYSLSDRTLKSLRHSEFTMENMYWLSIRCHHGLPYRFKIVHMNAFSKLQNDALTELLAEADGLGALLGDLSVSQEQARSILQNLPPDLGPERRAVVESACKLVGKVTYYWGGCALFLDNLRRNTQ